MAMQFTSLTGGNRLDGKAAKIATVAALHVALGAVFIHSMNTKKLSLSGLQEQVLVMIEPDHTPPPPPPEPPQPAQRLAPPDLFVPKTEVPVAPPPVPSPVQATTSEPDPSPFAPMQPAESAPQAPATPSANPGQMRTAVFADANGCALPAYPPAAQREGITGTSTLALLVGADGRVTSARVEHSSGSRVLDSAALNALSRCTFKPATNNGVPEAGWAKLAFVWTLD
jgi:protein TonB